MRGSKFWASLICFCLLVMVTVPAMAADPEPTKKDLKGISPQRYKYLFSVAGGAALGAGIGAIAGGAPNVGKGILIGGGGASALYLHTHKKDTLHGWRNWAYVASYTSFGGGLGWTLCGCNRGLVSGILIGGGVTGIWLAEHPQHTTPTAGTNNTNNP